MRYTIRSAFTLIEVLIAVLVLSLGVLGLAAVFSVGIPQQRIASDQIQGLNALASARATLLGNARLNDPRNPINPDGVLQERGWYGLQQQVAEDPDDLFKRDETWSPMGEWMLPLRDVADTDIDEVWMALDPIADAADQDVGEVTIVSPLGLALGDERFNARIGLEQRLVPAPYTTGSEPQYVWDFIARRVPGGEVDLRTKLVQPTQQDQIEIAVFVRRIDPGIRVQATRRDEPEDRVRYGNRLRLSDYLTMNAEQITGDASGDINEALRVVPVSVDPDSSQPRSDGRTLSANQAVGEYAMIYGIGVADVARYPGSDGGGPGRGGSVEIPRDRLPLEAWGNDPDGDENRLRLATQVGHRILDRFGNIYEIRGIDEELTEELGVPVVRIDPPAPSNLGSPTDFRYPQNPDDPDRDPPQSQRAFLTTPQTPIAVDVFRVTP